MYQKNTNEKGLKIINEILNLNDKLYIGHGKHRKCYLHPNNKNLCIKVLSGGTQEKVSQNEVKYYKQLHKRNISWNMIAKYFGNIQTNMGNGETFELIRDYDGNISKSVSYYLKLNTSDTNKEIIKLLEDLRQFIIKEQVLFGEIRLSNILVKKYNETTSKLIIIDGLGNGNIILQFIHIKNFALLKTAKKWEGFKLACINEFLCLKNNIKSFNA